MIAIGSLLLTVGAGLSYIEYFKLSDILLLCFLFLFFTFFFYKKYFIIGIFLSIFCFLGYFYFDLRYVNIDPDFFGERILESKITYVDKKIDSTNLTILDLEYKHKIRVHIKNGDFLSGDIVQIKGVVSPPEDFLTDTNRIFPYEKYLKSKNIFATIYDPEIKLIERGSFNINRFSETIRFRFSLIISRYIDYPYDGIVSGMILGYRGGLSSEIEGIFLKTGTIHVLVLSGYNIMLLAGFCIFLFSRLPRFLQVLLTSIAIIILVFISGAGIASIRAGIMGLIAILAKLLIEKYNPSRALVIAYLILFFWSPLSIFVDPGLHLSFLATFCMILVVPKFEKYFQFIPENKYFDIRGAVSVSLIASFYMLPYILFFSGNFSISFLISNILLSLVIPLIMLLGILIIFLSPLGLPSNVLGYILSYFLDFIFYLLEFFSSLPIYYTPPFSWWGVIGIYIVINIFLFRKSIKDFI